MRLARSCVSSIAITFLTLAGMASAARADGWASIDVKDLVSRSRYIGIGKLSINGRSDDGWLKGTLTFTQRIYSAIGDVKEYSVRIAPRTVPGQMQNWPSGKSGIWFVLKSGDTFEPVNHPACWMDESQAAAVANQAYEAAEKAYSEAEAVAKQQSSGNDTSDSAQSVAAYAALVAAADNTRKVPYQDESRQSQRFYNQVMSILETAGIKPPFGGDLSNPAAQNQFFEQARGMLGPGAAAMGELPGSGDPARASQLAAAQNNVASVYLELVRNTLGSSNPTESLKKMGPIPLQTPVGRTAAGAAKPPGGGPPGLSPGPGGDKLTQAPSEFRIPEGTLSQVPLNGSRKQMLGALAGNHAGGSLPGPAPKGPGGPPRPR